MWTAWGGRSSPEAHLSDLERELNLKTLINRQEWLGFTTPQQAYAWRTNELNQRKQMNYAEWAGYQTADQYLSYLQKERSALSGLNTELLARSAAYRSVTDAALSYADASRGTHASIGQLSEGLDLSGVNQFQQALIGLPDIVSTKLVVDDSAAIAQLAQYQALLRGVPHEETTRVSDVVTAAYAMGGTPIPSALPHEERIPVTFTGPWQDQFAAILADVAALKAEHAEIPVDLHIDPTEVAALKAKLGQLSVTELVTQHLVSQGGGIGGGGGPPPVAPAPGAPEPGNEGGAWAALAAAMGHAGDEATYYGMAAKTAAAATDGAAGRAAAAAPAFSSFAATLASAAGWFGIFGARIALFGGLAGTVGGVHLFIDAIIELIAILTLATVGILAAAAALGIFIGVANLAQDTLGRISDRLEATYTAATATGQAIYPLANSFDNLASKIRPEVWQLYGDALNMVGSRTGMLGSIAVKTGTYLDQLAAKVIVFVTSPGFQRGLTTLVSAGFGVLRQLGTLFHDLGQALVEFAKVAQTTHIAEDLLTVLDVMAKLLTLVLKLPTPILAVAVGLHGLYLWGGLLATGILSLLSPLRGLALALGGVAAAESAGGLGTLGKDASAWDRLKATVIDIGNGFGALPARIGLVTKAEEDAAAGAENAGTKYAGLSGILAKIGGVAGLATAGLGVLAGAAGVFAYMALTARDNAQKWINSLNTGLGQGSIMTVIGRTVSGLAAVTDQLTHSQGLNAQSVHELSGAQTDLSGKLQAELVHTADISRAYGVSMPQALALLNTAGVKTSSLFTDQSKVWAAAEVQVAGLVKGYAAMGQGLTQLQGDVSVQLVMNADQLASMAKLNTAWDSWLTLVSGGESSFVKIQQDFQNIQTSGQAAGSSMDGLNKNSLTLRAAFISMIPDAGKVLDSIRSQTAVLEDGAKGSALLTRATKDLAAEMIPLAGNNLAARAAIVATVEEADPAVNTWQKLTKWVGKEGAAGAANDLQRVMFTLATPVSNLAADAAKLTTALQQDLNPAMATAEFNALGGQKAFSTFASDLTKFGPGSQATITAGKQVAQMLLSIDKNSGTAKTQFVAWGESMGLTQKQAAQLWAEVSKGVTPLDSMRAGLAQSAAASDNLAKSGFFATRGDVFRTNMQEMANWFTKTLPDAFVTAGTAAGGFFGKTLPHEAGNVVTFFNGPFRTDLEGAWSHVWSALISPVDKFTGDVKHAITAGFDSWWKTHGLSVEEIWNSVTANLSMAWDNFTGGLKRAWDNFTGWFHGAGDVTKFMAGSWDKFYTSVVVPVLAQIKAAWTLLFGAMEVVAKITFDAIALALKTVWGAAMVAVKTAWDAAMLVMKVAWDTLVAVISIAIDVMTGHWKTAWTDVTNWFKQVQNALWDFLQQGWNNFDAFFRKLWDNSLAFLRQSWNAWWGWFYANIVQSGFGHFLTSTLPGWFTDVYNWFTASWKKSWNQFDSIIIKQSDNFFTHTFPGWLDDLGRFFSNLWKTVWGDFSNDVVGPMGRWFSSSLPNAIRNGFRDSINWVIDNVINKVINFIDNDILKHLPGSLHISTIGNVASGGDVAAAAGFAAGGPFARMSGSVPGASAVDGTRIMAMGGEYMVRQPARMALEATFGRGFMNWLNQFDQHAGAGSRGTPASQQRRPGINHASGGLVNPIGAGLRPERVDMGVDYGGSGELYALGSGTITNLWNSGWPGGTFLGLRLDPPYGSGYWYYAEDVLPLVGTGGIHVGAPVHAGQHIATALGGPSGIEVGWAAPPGTGQTEAAAQGQDKAGLGHGDPGAYPTAWGVAASNLIKSLGGPAGIISGPVQGGTAGIGGALAAIWQSVEGLLDAAGTGLGNLVKPLAGMVSGGAGELLKLARQGAASIFGAVWDHTVKPLVDIMPGDSIPGAISQGVAADIRQGIVNFMKGQDSNAQAQAAASSSAGLAIGPVNGPADAGPGQAENYALHQLARYGWGPDQMGPLSQLWMRESGWNRFARNPASGAYGIPQSLPPTKLPYAGQAGGGSHASPQIDWGLNYIKTTPGYGSPAAAWAHEQAHNWYAGGGAVRGWDGAVMAAGGLAGWPALTTAVGSEMDAMIALQHAHLPSKGPTMDQRHTFTAWQEALWSQQLKTIGLGRKPPGAYQALYSDAGSPAKMTAGQWSAFTGDLGYLTKEAEGTGAGGINPPGTPANSGWPAWHWLRSQWQSLVDRLRIAGKAAATAQAQWGSAYSVSGLPPGAAPGAGSTGTDSPEWDAASQAMLTAVRTEMDAMAAIQAAHLPSKGPAMSQRYDYTSWQEALWKQQLKTVGLGRKPPGAFQAIDDRLTAPGTITSGQWNSFTSDLAYLTREEEGPGAGGINPPGSRPNSGWPAWKYLHGDWQALLNAMRNAQAKTKTAEGVWSRLYGPSHLPYTPGPARTQAATPVPSGLVNVMPEATMGGPAMPVFDAVPAGPDMGFAAGGGLDQVASMFSGGLSPGGVMLPVVVRYGIPDSVLSQLSGSSASSSGHHDFPRRVSEAAAASRQGPAINFEQVTINNPLPQRPSDSLAHATGRLAFLAGRMS